MTGFILSYCDDLCREIWRTTTEDVGSRPTELRKRMPVTPGGKAMGPTNHGTVHWIGFIFSESGLSTHVAPRFEQNHRVPHT